MSKFKLGLTIVFTAFIIIGVIVFSASKGTNSGPVGNVTIWGFLSSSSFNTFYQNTALSKDKTITVNYVEKTKANFQTDFINALANGAGPDVVMISDDMLYTNEGKLFVIPYANYSQRTFKDTFIQGTEIFLGPTGVWAVPLAVDPLVLYWNRDIFNGAGLSQPPQYWDEVLTLPLRLSTVDHAGNVTQSAIALGEWANVHNAKAILSNLFLQAGTQIVDTTQSPPTSILLNSNNQTISPAEASVNFFTQFANPQSQTYSWNASLPDSLTEFLSGKLAVYIGFASELPTIRAKNPNLNFDVATIPQARQTSGQAKKTVFGHIYGLGIVKQSKNVPASFSVISQLTSVDSLTQFGSVTLLPSVSRTLLSVPATDAYRSIFNQSALVTATWLDPDPQGTDAVFQNMIESVVSGRARTSEALSSADQKLGSLFK